MNNKARNDDEPLEDPAKEPAAVLPLFRFYTLAETAGLLGVSKSVAYRLVRSGKLPAEQVGPHRQWCVHAADLVAATRVSATRPQ